MLKERLPGRAIEPHFDNGKHCYWKALSKDGMKRAVENGLKSYRYPKPMLDRGDTADCYSTKGKIKLPAVHREHKVVQPIDAGKRISTDGIDRLFR